MITYHNTHIHTKKTDILSILKDVEGQSLTVLQLSQVTGLSVKEIHKEIEKMIYNGQNVCLYKNLVYIPKKGEFPTYTILFIVGFLGTVYTFLQELANHL